MKLRSATLMGAGLVACYTLMISSADGITKLIAGAYEAPQLFFFSSLIVMGLSLISNRCLVKVPSSRGLRTGCVRAMFARSCLTVVACVAFFQAFRLLPFADVFLFIGLMPLIAALMSGPVLGESVRAQVWLALSVGVIGVLCLMPNGFSSAQVGHGWALVAAVSGTGSMIAARYIGRFETNALAQVFYPNLAIFLCMAVVLPFVFKPMNISDFAWTCAYAVFLFGARWVVVVALRLLPAYVATPLMNLQFVWMVAIGFFAFGETPTAGSLMGVTLVIGSGLYLVIDQTLPDRKARPQIT